MNINKPLRDPQLKSDVTISFIDSIGKVTPCKWHDLSRAHHPFFQYSFLNTLEKSQSVSAEQGWKAHHLVASRHDELIAVMPMYLKSHSWGEFVFDWAWAEAYERNGLDYYPKLVATVPFTPVESDKLLSSELKIHELFSSLIEHCNQTNINSWHILYCEELQEPLPDNVFHRNTVQFHWYNRNYRTFEDFLSSFTSRKRKNTLKERRSITQQGISIRQLTTNEISAKDLEFFYLTYQITYAKRGHQPHLSYEFFKILVADKTNKLLLNIASADGEDIACALFFYDDYQLFGRYWGCTKTYKNLHFELCYYLGIEFCIEHKLQRFNPGTQGEHKIKRGFEPVLTHSYHWVKHRGFQPAVKDFCEREQQHMLIYQQECQQQLPFKQNDNQPLNK